MAFFLNSMLFFTSSDEEENTDDTDQEDRITKIPVKSKKTTMNVTEDISICDINIKEENTDEEEEDEEDQITKMPVKSKKTTMNVTEDISICDIKMNVTEKQKQIIINFMRNHPDFGKGRLRYNSGNKKIMDELWRELTAILNGAGCGPRKLPKEWAKTWRDWRANLLKKISAHNTKYSASGAGEKPPKNLVISPAEKDLLEFLTPDTDRIPGLTQRESASDTSSVSESPCNSDDLKSTIDDFQTDEHHHQQANKTVIINKRKRSNDTDINNKRVKIQNIKDSFQQHRSSNILQYCNMHEELLQLKREKIKLIKEKFKFKKQAHEEHMDLLKTIIETINTATNVIRSLAPEYLE